MNALTNWSYTPVSAEETSFDQYKGKLVLYYPGSLEISVFLKKKFPHTQVIDDIYHLFVIEDLCTSEVCDTKELNAIWLDLVLFIHSTCFMEKLYKVHHLTKDKSFQFIIPKWIDIKSKLYLAFKTGRLMWVNRRFRQEIVANRDHECDIFVRYVVIALAKQLSKKKSYAWVIPLYEPYDNVRSHYSKIDEEEM